MTVVGQPREFEKKFSFVVEIEGIESANFTKSGPLEAEIAVIEQHEGGSLVPDMSPGRVTVAPLTLERGTAKGDSDLYKWWQDVVRISANSGLTGSSYRRDVEIVQLDRDGSVIRRWILGKCWPKKFSAGDWDNDADENKIESVELVIQTFDLIEGGSS